MIARSPAPARRTRAEIIALMESEDSDGALLDLILDDAAHRDPELPEVLRACAIPRKITAQVIGILRGKPDDETRNSEFLDLVRAHAFVTSRQGGGFAYHDSTRDSLLADWRSSPEKAARFTELNEALVTFHKARYADGLASDRLLTRVRPLIASTNQGRLGRLGAAIDSALGASIQDAAYHVLLASPQDVEDLVTSAFFDLEPGLKVGVVQGLIWFVRDHIRRYQPAVSPSLGPWLDYFESRIARVYPGYDAGRQVATLASLTNDPGIPDKLRSWALDDLALVHQEQWDLSAALRLRVQLAGRDEDIDAWNAPVAHLSLAYLHTLIGDPGPALRAYRDAITVSEGLPGARRDIAVYARLALAERYGDLCDWDRAFDAAAEALHAARTAFCSDRALAQAAAAGFARLLGRFDHRASDCAAAEALKLASIGVDALPAAVLERIDALLAADRNQTALSLIAETAATVRSPRAPLLSFDLASRRGEAIEMLQRADEAEVIYSELLARLPDGPETTALSINTRTRRGGALTDLGDLEGAIADLAIVQETLDRCGFRLGAAYATAGLIIAYARAGHLEAARKLLSAADASIPDIPSSQRHYLWEAKGELAEAQGDLPSAREHYEQALDYATAAWNLGRQELLLRKLAALHHRQADPELAAGYARQAQRVASAIASADAATPTVGQRTADEELRLGIEAFVTAEDRSGSLAKAREHFEAAVAADAANPWPAFDLAFTYAEQEDWQGAYEEMRRALELSPAPLRRAPRLLDCLGDHALRHARTILRWDLPWPERAAAIGRVRDRVAGMLPGSLLSPVLASHALALLFAGAAQPAADACREALALASDGGQVAAELTPLIRTAEEFWAVSDMLQTGADTPGQGAAVLSATVTGAATRAQEALLDRLCEILGLLPDPAGNEILPVAVPIILELGDELVPQVDSRQDGGVFLYEMVPELRDRIAGSSGVTVPGVRARQGAGLAPRGYRILIEESLALDDMVPAEGAPDGLRPAPPPQHIINQLESVLRANLARFLGPEEVATLIRTWTEQDAALTEAVVPDADAVLPITWLLQRLVIDGVPIADWRTVLTAIRDSGGITADLAALYRSVRERVTALLPGPWTGRTAVMIPERIEAALTGSDPASSVAARALSRLEFICWLRDAVTESGTELVLVARSPEGREAAAAFGRAESSHITTLTVDEVAAHA